MKRLLPLLALLLALPTPALAHGETGTLELVTAEPADGTAVRYVVRLTYESDGDAASSTDLRVVIDAADPMPMVRERSGLYSATATFPGAGEHAVLFTAEEPTARLEHFQVVDDPATTSTTGAPSVADEPLPDDPESDGSAAWLLVLMAIIVTVMVVVAVAFVRGRRPPA